MGMTMTGNYGGVGILTVLAILWGVGVTIFYMACAWRAMIAHEKLAAQMENLTALHRLQQQEKKTIFEPAPAPDASPAAGSESGEA